MNSNKEYFLKKALLKREEEGSLRTLSTYKNLIDFCSNDYLGFARSKELKNAIAEASENNTSIGSTGSRLLSGNSQYIEQLEAFIANYHHAEAGLIYNSGYDANIGLFSSIAKRGDTIIYDELIHASIHDGMRLTYANSLYFKHNNVEHLEERLKMAKGNIFVAVESVYSMDGDFSPLPEIADVCEKYGANLIVDEAHATGIFGDKGEGRVCELMLQDMVFARVHTFGKALGCHGAIVLGSNLLRNFLINFSRSLIYTTSMSFDGLNAIKCGYEMLVKSKNRQLKALALIDFFKYKVNDLDSLKIIESFSPIQCLILGGNNETKQLAISIQKEGFDVRPILSPTVAKGKERLRICLHYFNTEQEVNDLVTIIVKNIN